VLNVPALKGSLGANTSLVARALAILLLGQIIFWMGLVAAERLAKPAGFMPAPHADLFMTEDGEIAPGAELIRVPLLREPGYIYRDDAANNAERRGVFRTEFTLDNTESSVGLYLGWMHRIKEVRVNGSIVKGQTPFDAWGEVGGFAPGVYIFPNEFLVEGNNVLTVEVHGSGVKGLPVFHVGEASKIVGAQAWGRIFSFDLAIVSIAVMAIVSLLCFLVNWPAEERELINSLIGLLILWCLRNLQVLGLDAILPEAFSWLSYNALIYTLMLALLEFCVRWTKLGSRFLRFRAYAYGAAIVVPLVLVVFDITYLGSIDIAWMIETAVTLGVGLAVMILFAFACARKSGQELLETVLFIVCATALVVDAADDRFQLIAPLTNDLALTFYVAPMMGSFLGLGVCASIAAQATRARLVTLRMNETLERKLAERENEIRGQAKLNAIVDERQRLMRDMHDGLGSSLLNIVLRTRNKSLPYDDVSGEVQGALDELRLIIDSLDSAGDTLALAMAAFRERIESQFAAADITLDWQNDKSAMRANYTASEVLQVYRVLQEACTNVIRHADASDVQIALSAVEDDSAFPFAICVRDNGRGIIGDRTAGKGVASMKARASRLQGKLDIESDASGTVVMLCLPPPSV